MGVMPTIVVPPMPPWIKDPADVGQKPPVTINGIVAIYIQQGKLKQIPGRQLALQEGVVAKFTETGTSALPQ